MSDTSSTSSPRRHKRSRHHQQEQRDSDDDDDNANNNPPSALEKLIQDVQDEQEAAAVDDAKKQDKPSSRKWTSRGNERRKQHAVSERSKEKKRFAFEVASAVAGDGDATPNPRMRSYYENIYGKEAFARITVGLACALNSPPMIIEIPRLSVIRNYLMDKLNFTMGPLNRTLIRAQTNDDVIMTRLCNTELARESSVAAAMILSICHTSNMPPRNHEFHRLDLYSSSHDLDLAHDDATITLSVIEHHHTTTIPRRRHASTITVCGSSGEEFCLENFFHQVICCPPWATRDGSFTKSKQWKDWRTKTAQTLAPAHVNLLMAAIDSLVIGGTVIYFTESLNPVENEDVVRRVLQMGGEKSLRLVDIPVEARNAVVGSSSNVTSIGCCVFPTATNGGGFFVAMIQKLQQVTWASRPTHDELVAAREEAGSGISSNHTTPLSLDPQNIHVKDFCTTFDFMMTTTKTHVLQASMDGRTMFYVNRVAFEFANKLPVRVLFGVGRVIATRKSIMEEWEFTGIAELDGMNAIKVSGTAASTITSTLVNEERMVAWDVVGVAAASNAKAVILDLPLLSRKEGIRLSTAARKKMKKQQQQPHQHNNNNNNDVLLRVVGIIKHQSHGTMLQLSRESYDTIQVLNEIM